MHRLGVVAVGLGARLVRADGPGGAAAHRSGDRRRRGPAAERTGAEDPGRGGEAGRAARSRPREGRARRARHAAARRVRGALPHRSARRRAGARALPRGAPGARALERGQHGRARHRAAATGAGAPGAEGDRGRREREGRPQGERRAARGAAAPMEPRRDLLRRLGVPRPVAARRHAPAIPPLEVGQGVERARASSTVAEPEVGRCIAARAREARRCRRRARARPSSRTCQVGAGDEPMAPPPGSPRRPATAPSIATRSPPRCSSSPPRSRGLLRARARLRPVAVGSPRHPLARDRARQCRRGVRGREPHFPDERA